MMTDKEKLLALIDQFASGEKFEVPDYALDMHTVRGRAMGRDVYHFLTEASRVSPYYVPEGAAEIYEKYRQLLESGEADEKVPGAFEYNSWQY